MPVDSSKRIALVTGGGTGIGRATALKLAKNGIDVAVNYSKSKREASGTVDELLAFGVSAIAVRADVSELSDVESMVAQVSRELGKPDILINSAGITRFIPYDKLDDVTDEAWDAIFDVNVRGAFYCAREAARGMTDGGVIVNVASTSGVTGLGSSIPYAASKAALIGLTKALARALVPNIRVNAVAPGVVTTRWVDGQDEFAAKSAASTPMGRNATAEDVAEVIYSLVASAGFVTGQTLIIDGGRVI